MNDTASSGKSAKPPIRGKDAILAGEPQQVDLWEQLLARPNLNWKQASAPTSLRRDPVARPADVSAFADLPAISPIAPEEHRAALLLSGVIGNNLAPMIGSWLAVEEVFEDGKTTVSQEVVELSERLKARTSTTMVFPDAWAMGLPLVQKLLRAARKQDGGVQLDQELATIYAQCKFDKTMDGTITDFTESTRALIERIDKDELALAKKLAHQMFREDECRRFRAIDKTVGAGGTVSMEDAAFIEEHGMHLMSYTKMPDELFTVAPELLMKVTRREALDESDRQKMHAIIEAALKNPPLTAAEQARVDSTPVIKEFAEFVVQVGYARFGSLIMASNMLQGYTDAEHNYHHGAFECARAYLYLEQIRAPYEAQARAHRAALQGFEQSLEYLQEVQQRFSLEKGLVTDVPQPNPDLLERAATAITTRIPEFRENTGPLYYLNKEQVKAQKKLSSTTLREAIAGLSTKFSGIVERRNRYADTFQTCFAEVTKALCDKLRSGEPYGDIDTNHQEMILALQELRRNLAGLTERLTKEVDAEIAQQLKKYGGHVAYKEFLNGAYKDAANKIAAEVRATDEAVAAALDSLINVTGKERRAGVTEDQVEAARSCGESVEGMYETKKVPLDDMSMASIAADRMVEYGEIIVHHMKERQALLDQYVAAEKGAASVRTPG